MGRIEALRRTSVPELLFGHFSNKYGQKSLVDEYAACLVNTLEAYGAGEAYGGRVRGSCGSVVAAAAAIALGTQHSGYSEERRRWPLSACVRATAFLRTLGCLCPALPCCCPPLLAACCLAGLPACLQAGDVRLETFGRFLREEWGFAAFMDFLAASSMAMQVGGGEGRRAVRPLHRYCMHGLPGASHAMQWGEGRSRGCEEGRQTRRALGINILQDNAAHSTQHTVTMSVRPVPHAPRSRLGRCASSTLGRRRVTSSTRGSATTRRWPSPMPCWAPARW